MKPFVPSFPLLFLALSSASAVRAASGDSAAELTPLQNETSLIVSLHTAARAADDSTSVALLKRPATGSLAQLPPSILLARRATAACACLVNGNEPEKAMRLARRTVLLLAAMDEKTDEDRVERLIWEATLVGQFLDDKKQAVALLQVALTIAPENERIKDMEAGFAAALTAFGR